MPKIGISAWNNASLILGDNFFYGQSLTAKLEKSLTHKSYDKKNNNEEYENLTFEESLRALEEIVDELAWDDGTVVEWETQDDGKVVLRNIDGLELD